MQEHWSRRGYLGTLAGIACSLAGTGHDDRPSDEADAGTDASGLQTLTVRIPKEVADDLDIEAGDDVLYQGGS